MAVRKSSGGGVRALTAIRPARQAAPASTQAVHIARVAYPVPGQNDLSTLYPELVREWDEEKNLPLSPGTVLPSSHRYVWWRCSEGHVWRSVIFTRARGTFCSCPVCAGKVRRSKNIPSMYIPAGDAITNTKEEKRL